MIQTREKTPAELKDFTYNWAPDLGDDEVETSTWAIADSTIAVESFSQTLSTTTVWAQDGTVGDGALITNRILTTAGRVLEWTFAVFVKEFNTGDC